MNVVRWFLVAVVLSWAIPAVAQSDAVFEAARQNDPEKLRELLAASPELVNARSEDGETPLHIAAMTGRNEAALFLIGKGAAIDARNSVDQSPLLYAAYRGNAALVDTLIALGAPFDVRDARGSAPIHYAARQGNLDVIGLLAAKGAAFDGRGAQGRTPLFLAAANGRAPVLRFLASRGAKLDTRDDAGRSPLAAALEGGHAEAAGLLLDAGLPVEGDAAALGRFVHLAAAAGNQKIVDALIEKGAVIDAASEDGRTLLHEAAIGGLQHLAETMLRRGTNVNATDKAGRTALHWAVAGNRAEVVRMLLDAGADPNAADAAGRTPLHMAEDAGRPELEKLLRERGARDIERRVYRLARTNANDSAKGVPLDVAYIGNEGFLISRGEKKVLIDALHRNPWNYPATGERVYAMMLDGRPPFEGLDLSVASHAHADHMSGRMNAELLLRNPAVSFVSGPEACDSLRRAAGADFETVEGRVVAVDPEWGKVARLRLNGVDLELFGVNHAGPGDPPYKTLAAVIDLDGIRVAHLADEQSVVNVENYRSVDLAREGIDVAFADRMMLQDSIGQYIIRELVKPRYLVLMHAQPGELDADARDLAPLHPNLLIFREQLERRRFAF